MPRDKHCFCQIPDKEFQCNFEKDWDEIISIPGMSNVLLFGNDSNEGIKTCKIILAVMGKKLDTLLDKSKDVTLKLDYPLSIVKQIHDFALSSQLKYNNEENLLQLLNAASDYDLYGIKKFGGVKLLSMISNENVLTIYQLCEDLLCSHFTSQVKQYILVNFQDLVLSPDFLQKCSTKWIEDWIKSDELNCSEELIFTSVSSWAKLSPENAEAFQDLVHYIRFPLLKPEFFDQVVKTSELLKKGNSHIEKFEKSLRRNSYRAHSLRFRTEKFRLPHELVFAVGGFGSEALSAVEVFDIRAKKWTALKQNLPPHAYHGVMLCDNCLFVLGGFGDEGNGLGPSFYNCIYRFDFFQKSWTKIPNEMGASRCYVSVAELNGHIYSMGGYNGQIRLRSVEKFDPQDNSITPVAPMRDVRSDASAVSYGGKIIIIGGYTGAEILNSTEIYDPVTESWTYGPVLNIPRSGVKAVIFEHKIYAVGGFNGVERLRSVETLDLLTPGAAWIVTSQLNIPRSNASITVVDKAIMVAGGFDGSGVIAESEFYDSKTNTWMSGAPMNLKKSALSLVTVPNLPNRKHFLPYWKKA